MIKVYSKIKLDENLKKDILDYINSLGFEDRYSLKDIDFEIDKNILSGIRIDVDSEIYDLTLNSRLEKILELLK
jgi:F0F1-type ATP synthase delta subunit